MTQPQPQQTAAAFETAFWETTATELIDSLRGAFQTGYTTAEALQEGCLLRLSSLLAAEGTEAAQKAEALQEASCFVQAAAAAFIAYKQRQAACFAEADRTSLYSLLTEAEGAEELLQAQKQLEEAIEAAVYSEATEQEATADSKPYTEAEQAADRAAAQATTAAQKAQEAAEQACRLLAEACWQLEQTEGSEAALCEAEQALEACRQLVTELNSHRSEAKQKAQEAYTAATSKQQAELVRLSVAVLGAEEALGQAQARHRAEQTAANRQATAEALQSFDRLWRLYEEAREAEEAAEEAFIAFWLLLEEEGF